VTQASGTTQLGSAMEYVAEREGWSVYQLEDGARVKMRAILTRIARNGFDPNGRPAYALENVVITQIEPAPVKATIKT
jgi:hypothetical protein